MQTNRPVAAKAGSALAGLLMVVLIVGLLVGYIYFAKTGGVSPAEKKQMKELGVQGSGTSVLKQSVDKAKETECKSNLRQIRQSLQMFAMSGDTLPASLQELGLPQSMLVCPVSGEAYQYDPSTGQVQCPTHPNF